MAGLITRAVQWIARLLLTISALCLTALMCLTVAEVIGRYGFNAPIKGRQDIAQILLACSIFFALPVVTLRGEQIVADLLDPLFNAATGFWRDRIIEALTSITLLTMGYWLFERAEKALRRGTTSELLFLPKYPLLIFVATMVFVTGVCVALICIWRVLRHRLLRHRLLRHGEARR